MTRKECLDEAAKCVLRDRNNTYGGPEDSFAMIAGMWSAYLGVPVDAVDVAMLMGMLKMARIRTNKDYNDGYVDLAGYAACGAECAQKGRADFTPKDKPAPVHSPEDVSFDQDRMRESMPGIVPQDGPSDFDAPQTKEELMQRIVDCNPAVYGRAHKPTGEELAEMAEEEQHG